MLKLKLVRPYQQPCNFTGLCIVLEQTSQQDPLDVTVLKTQSFIPVGEGG